MDNINIMSVLTYLVLQVKIQGKNKAKNYSRVRLQNKFHFLNSIINSKSYSEEALKFRNEWKHVITVPLLALLHGEGKAQLSFQNSQHLLLSKATSVYSLYTLPCPFPVIYELLSL